MAPHQQLDTTRVAHVDAALRPHAWRRMSARAVSVRLVEVLDGAVAEADDVRVWIVERRLSACRWRGLTLAGLARQAAVALDDWHAGRRRLDAELDRLLGDA